MPRGSQLKVMLCLLVLLWPALSVGVAAEPASQSYTLDDCLKLAYQNSETLKTADLNVTKARYAVTQAQAGLGPTLTYNATAKDAEGTAVYDGALTASQTLYSWGKLSAKLKITRYNLENALEDARQAKQQLTYDVKDAYYQLWLAARKLEVAESSHENMGKHYSDMEQRFQEGTKSKYQLLQAEVQWKKLKPDVIAAQNEISLRRTALAILMGINSDQSWGIDEKSLDRASLPQIDLTTAQALEIAYRDRPELRQMKNTIELAKLETKIVMTEYYPTLNLSGTYGNGKSGAADWEDTWALTLNLSGTLFDCHNTQAQVASARASETIALNNEAALRDQVRLKLEQGLQNLAESWESIEANQANIELAQETLRLTRIKLEEGMATTTDLMDAQLDLDEASNGYYEDIRDYLSDLANLDLVMGKDL